MTKTKKITCILCSLLVGLVAVIMPFVLKPKNNTFAESVVTEQVPSVDPNVSGDFNMPYFYMPLASYSGNSGTINYHGVIVMSFKFLSGNAIVFDYATGRYNQNPGGDQTLSFETMLYYLNSISGGIGSSLEQVNVSTLGGSSYKGRMLRYNEVITSLDDTFIYLGGKTSSTGSTIPFVIHFVVSPLDGCSTFNGNVMYYNITYGWSYDNYFVNHFTNYSSGKVTIVNYNYYSFNGACVSISFPLFVNNDVVYQQPSQDFYTTTAIPESDAFNAGYSNGYYDGNDAGYTNGYAQGNTAGYNRGESVGYNAGYNAGILDSSDYSFLGLIGATVDAPITALTGLLNFEILGVNLSSFFFGLMTITLIIVIIKYIKGGS